MADTTNSAGEIVSGTRVKIKGEDTVYDVGEICKNTAILYSHNKNVGKIPLKELISL